MEATAEKNVSADDSPSAEQGMKLLKSFVSETKTIPGRRHFFRYRDLGVTDASNGRMRANIVESIAGMTEPTGWHYHECDMQFVYIIKGEVVIEFEDGTVATFGPGDAMFIPGGTIHNEIYLSEDKVSLEVSLTAKLGTVKVERSQRRLARIRAACLAGRPHQRHPSRLGRPQWSGWIR
jgi:mannose-6-phosphate isomerase-like protein (cupin superfamily)